MNVGLAAVESTGAVVLEVPGVGERSSRPSGSLEPAEENVTVSGAAPESGVALADADGERAPSLIAFDAVEGRVLVAGEVAAVP